MVSSKLCAQSKFIVQGIGRFTHRFTASRLLYCYTEGPRGARVSITKILYCSFVVLYFKIYCVKFQDSNLNFIFLQLFWVAILVDWGELSKNYLIAFCQHIDCMSMQNLESAAPMVSEKRCLHMTDRRTDGQTDGHGLFALIKNIYIL